MADVLLEQLILQPALVEYVMLVGLHNEQDASTVSISIRPSDTIRVVGLRKTFSESRGGVVL
jgi:hypothetical protein